MVSDMLVWHMRLNLFRLEIISCDYNITASAYTVEESQSDLNKEKLRTDRYD